MKVFGTLLYEKVGFIASPIIVTDRYLPARDPDNKGDPYDLLERYAATSLPTVSYDHHTPEDFIKFFPNGNLLFGYYHGDETVLEAVQAFIADRNLVRNTNFLEAAVVTCGDNEHPCDNMPEPWFKRGDFFEKFDPESWPPNWDQM